ncbi:hypothetical protein T492DRAFT_590561, partial [Pavlovales sp. CCMP2436]
MAALLAEEDPTQPQRTVAQLRPAKPVLLYAKGTSVLDAARAMAAKRADAALVVAADGTLLGIVTDTDVSRRVVAKSLDASTLAVTDAMTANPKTASSSQPAMAALRTMVANHFRHLPVVEAKGSAASGLLDLTRCLYHAITALEKAQQSSDALGSVISQVRAEAAGGGGAVADAALDALLASAAQMFAPTLGDVLARTGGEGDVGCATVGTNETVREAALLMSGARRAVMVLDEEGGVAGILTSRDVLFRVVAAGLSADTTNVTSVMTASPDCTHPEATILETLHTMHDNRYQHMPVTTASGELLGVVDALQLAYVALGGGADGSAADSFWESALQLGEGADSETKSG